MGSKNLVKLCITQIKKEEKNAGEVKRGEGVKEKKRTGYMVGREGKRRGGSEGGKQNRLQRSGVLYRSSFRNKNRW